MRRDRGESRGLKRTVRNLFRPRNRICGREYSSPSSPVIPTIWNCSLRFVCHARAISDPFSSKPRESYLYHFILFHSPMNFKTDFVSRISPQIRRRSRNQSEIYRISRQRDNEGNRLLHELNYTSRKRAYIRTNDYLLRSRGSGIIVPAKGNFESGIQGRANDKGRGDVIHKGCPKIKLLKPHQYPISVERTVLWYVSRYRAHVNSCCLTSLVLKKVLCLSKIRTKQWYVVSAFSFSLITRGFSEHGNFGD